MKITPFLITLVSMAIAAPKNYFFKNLNGGDYPIFNASPTSKVPTGDDYPTFKDPETSSVSTGGDYPQFRDPQTPKVSSTALAEPQQSDYPTPRTTQEFPYSNNYFLKNLNGGDYPIFSASPTSRVLTGDDYPTFKDPETSSVSTGGNNPKFRDPQTSGVSSMALAAPQQSDYPTPRNPQKFPYSNNYFLKNLNEDDPTFSASQASSVPTGGDNPTFKDPETSSVSTGGDYPQFRDPQTSKVSSMALAAPQQSDYPTPRTPQKFPYPNNYFLKNLNGGDYPIFSASPTSSVPTGGDYPTFKDPETSSVSTGGDYPQFRDPQTSKVSSMALAAPQQSDYPTPRAPQEFPYSNNYFLKNLNEDDPTFSASQASSVPTGGDNPTFKDPETSSVSTGGDYPQFRDPQTSGVSSMALAAPQQSDYPTPRSSQKFPYSNDYFLKNLNGWDYPTFSPSQTSSFFTGGDYKQFGDPQTSRVSTGGDYPQFRDPQASGVSSMVLAAPQQSDYPTPRAPKKFPYSNYYFLKNLNGWDYPKFSASQTSSFSTGGDYKQFGDPQTSRVSTGGYYPQFRDPQISGVSSMVLAAPQQSDYPTPRTTQKFPYSNYYFLKNLNGCEYPTFSASQISSFSTGGDYKQFGDPQTSRFSTGGDYPQSRYPQTFSVPTGGDNPVFPLGIYHLLHYVHNPICFHVRKNISP
ncbi:uncharacterized protein LOC143915552 [Arctopsyche grandis]|uniref:uncharacterized protein LOC143915552 n=1 Tax=Arctopsyche grandis TaxID=121162 RepID=UPI00406D9174